MHRGLHRAAKRRGAPSLPKRRSRKAPERNPFRRETSGFEGLIPAGSSEDFFFSGFISDPEEAAEILEHGEQRESFDSNPRLGVTVSAGFHILLVLFLLIEPSLELLGARTDREAAEAEEENPLLVFMEEPKPELPPIAVVPLVPAPPAQPPPPPAEKPSQVAQDRMVIPKAMLPSPKPKEFMNDLPFSEGKTEEFYTDKEVKDPGKEGEREKPDEPEDEPVMVEESGEDEKTAEASEGKESGTGGVEKPETLSPSQVADLLFGDARAREASRARSDIRPPEPKPPSREVGEGGENGAFTDIRRFLAGARFDNPEGGLVSNTGNTLYYNDKGANFVPWLRRMLAEVRRNWLFPYSVAFDHGHVAIGISVARDGTVTDMTVLLPSGVSGFDNAAVGALRAAQLMPLPADYPDDKFDIILVFWYNERPYDLFG